LTSNAITYKNKMRNKWFITFSKRVTLPVTRVSDINIRVEQSEFLLHRGVKLNIRVE